MKNQSENTKRENLNKFGPYWLPIVICGNFAYFADLQLKEFRRVEIPNEKMTFDSKKGHTLLQRYGFAHCPHCTQRAAVLRARKPKKIQCVRCLETYEL